MQEQRGNVVAVYQTDLSDGRPAYDEARVGEAIKRLFESLQLDSRHIGTDKWNPLGDIVRPGDKVVLKPNFVKESHLFRPDDWEYVVTHGTVIKWVTEYVLRALNGQGRVIIADGPQTDSSFDKIVERTGVREYVEEVNRRSAVPVELLDLRQEEWTERDGVIVTKRTLSGDPLGYTKVALNEKSEFAGIHGRWYYGASYDMEETNRHHKGNLHEYMISATALSADVIINLPKLKTHKKTGVTLNLKNMVGINGNKNWLPHHTEGTPEQGGDQFPRATPKAKLEHRLMGTVKRVLKGSPTLSRLFVPFKKLGRSVFGDTEEVIRSGNWYGNDTAWRMVLDLNKAMFYYDHEGRLRSSRRRYFSVVDGIMGGEGNGPMAPDPRYDGLLLAGTDPVAVDCVAAKLMGFDYTRIRKLIEAFRVRDLPLTDLKYEDIDVVSNQPRWHKLLKDIKPEDTLRYRPHFGWRDHIELEYEATTAAKVGR